MCSWPFHGDLRPEGLWFPVTRAQRHQTAAGVLPQGVHHPQNTPYTQHACAHHTLLVGPATHNGEGGESPRCVSHVSEETALLQRPEAGCAVGERAAVRWWSGARSALSSRVTLRRSGCCLALLGTEPPSSRWLTWTPRDEDRVLGSAHRRPLAALQEHLTGAWPSSPGGSAHLQSQGLGLLTRPLPTDLARACLG